MTKRVWDLSVEELTEIGRAAALEAVARQQRAGMVVDVVEDGRSTEPATPRTATITVSLPGVVHRYVMSLDRP